MCINGMHDAPRRIRNFRSLENTSSILNLTRILARQGKS